MISGHTYLLARTVIVYLNASAIHIIVSIFIAPDSAINRMFSQSDAVPEPPTNEIAVGILLLFGEIRNIKGANLAPAGADYSSVWVQVADTAPTDEERPRG